MSIAGLPGEAVTQFRGPFLSPGVEASDVQPDALTIAENVVFGNGYVKTREGHSTVFSPNSAVPFVYHWTAKNAIVYEKTGGVLVVRYLANGSEYNLITLTGTKTAQEMGERLYICNGSSLYVWDGLFTNEVPNIQVAAAPPLSTTLSVVENVTAGNVTAGLHKFGYILGSTSGFSGKPSPVVGGMFTPVVITAVGGKTLTVSLTIPSTPAWSGTVYLIMTTADNPERYHIVTGSSRGIAPSQTNFQVSWDVDVSDEVLSKYLDATDRFSLLTQGELVPRMVSTIGTRLVLVDSISVLISDPMDAQSYTNDRHRQYVPGGRVIKAMSRGRGVLYAAGDSFIGSLVDTGDYPSTWPQMTILSESIGTQSLFGISANMDHGYLWIAADNGLYLFDGTKCSETPASAWQTADWDRINWASPDLVKVIDSAQEQRVYVIAPLDGASTATHILTFDYSGGRTPGRIKYSLDSITGKTPASACLYKDPSSSRQHLMIGMNEAGDVMKRLHSDEAFANTESGHLDGAAPIRSRIVTGPSPSSKAGAKNVVRGAIFDAYGSVSVAPTVVNASGRRLKDILPLQLSADKAKTFSRRIGVKASKVMVEFGSPNGWWLLSGYETKYAPGVTR